MSLEFEKIYPGQQTGDRTGTGAKTAGGMINRNFEKIKNYLETPDQFIAVNGFGFEGQDLVFQEDWAWRINGQSYSNPELVEVPFPFAMAGKKRIDLGVATTSNTFMRVAGEESATTPFAPALPPNTLLVTTVLVTDNSVSDPTPPITGGNFQTKTEKATVIVAGGGGGFLSVSDEKATYDISSYGSPLQGLEDQQGFLYDGKEIIFRNTGTNPLTFVHDATSSANNKNYFTFPTGLNLVLQPNESFVCQKRGNGRLAYVGLIPSKGDMMKSVYDTTNSGIVDGSEGVVRYVYAQEAISKGDPVYVSTTGDPTFVMRARADNAAKMPAFAVAQQDIASGQVGKVTLFGSVRNLNTGSFQLGKNVYVGTTGGLTATVPTLNPQMIGVVVRTGGSDGVVAVAGQPIDTKSDISNQIEIPTATANADASWHGKTVIFTVNCTVTVVNTVPNQFTFEGIVLPNVTVGWAIQAPLSWLVTPTSVVSGAGIITIFTLMRRGSTNNVMVLGI